MSRPTSTERSLFRYCPHCATPLTDTPGASIRLPVCAGCGYVQYRNPVAGVAAVIYEDEVSALLGEERIRDGTGRAGGPPTGGRVLLARRVTTHRGLYCLPCGYVEFDEEIREAIRRETEEETGLLIAPGDVIAVHSNFHDPDRQSVGIWFLAHPVGGDLRPGDDVDALIFASPAEPGVPLAFPTDALVLTELARRRR